MSLNRKQLIYLFVGTVGVLLIFVVYLVLQQSSQRQATKVTVEVTPAPTTTTSAGTAIDGGRQIGQAAAKPTAVPQQTMNAAQTAIAFYNATLRSNPLANGGYKNSPYLTADFKDLIGSSYNNGNKSVFCQQNRRPQVSVGREVQKYYDQGYQTQEVLVDPSNGQELYIVVLENNNNVWQVFDVTCL